MELVQIGTIHNHQWLVKCEPVCHSVAEQSETLAGKLREQINHVLRFPTAVFVLQFNRHVEME